jgi:hypothetical protein
MRLHALRQAIQTFRSAVTHPHSCTQYAQQVQATCSQQQRRSHTKASVATLVKHQDATDVVQPLPLLASAWKTGVVQALQQGRHALRRGSCSRASAWLHAMSEISQKPSSAASSDAAAGQPSTVHTVHRHRNSAMHLLPVAPRLVQHGMVALRVTLVVLNDVFCEVL